MTYSWGKNNKLEVDPLGEEGKEEKIGRKEGRKKLKIKKSNKVRNPEVKSIFLSVEPGSGHKAKIFRNFWKHVFFANWTI